MVVWRGLVDRRGTAPGIFLRRDFLCGVQMEEVRLKTRSQLCGDFLRLALRLAWVGHQEHVGCGEVAELVFNGQYDIFIPNTRFGLEAGRRERRHRVNAVALCLGNAGTALSTPTVHKATARGDEHTYLAIQGIRFRCLEYPSNSRGRLRVVQRAGSHHENVTAEISER
ncbi:MAG: hypothetical protein U0R71_04080 [Solirubrobacterales bacterium]